MTYTLACPVCAEPISVALVDTAPPAVANSRPEVGQVDGCDCALSNRQIVALLDTIDYDALTGAARENAR